MSDIREKDLTGARLECVSRTDLNKDGMHRRYAERDLATLGTEG